MTKKLPEYPLDLRTQTKFFFVAWVNAYFFAEETTVSQKLFQNSIINKSTY